MHIPSSFSKFACMIHVVETPTPAYSTTCTSGFLSGLTPSLLGACRNEVLIASRKLDVSRTVWIPNGAGLPHAGMRRGFHRVYGRPNDIMSTLLLL